MGGDHKWVFDIINCLEKVRKDIYINVNIFSHLFETEISHSYSVGRSTHSFIIDTPPSISFSEIKQDFNARKFLNKFFTPLCKFL